MQFEIQEQERRRKEIEDNYVLENEEDNIGRDVIRDCGDQVEMFCRSEFITGLIRFVIAFSAISLLTNNIFDLNYKYQAFQFLEENFDVVAVLYQAGAALIVAFNMVESPFTTDNSYDKILHGCALLIACQSPTVTDPELLFTTSTTISRSFEDLSDLEKKNLTSVEFSSVQQNIGNLLITTVAFSKFILLVAGIINVLEIDDEFNSGFFSHLKNWDRLRLHIRALCYRQWYQFILLTSTAITYGLRFGFTEEKIIDNIKALNRENSGFLEYLESVGVDEVYYLAASLFGLLATGKYLFSERKHGYVLLMFINLQNIVQYNEYLYQGPVVMLTIVLIYLCFLGAVINFEIHLNQIDPQNFFYKLGHVLAITGMLFIIPAATYNWFSFTVQDNLTAGIDGIRLSLDKVAAKIGSIITIVFDFAANLQPCIRSSQPDRMNNVIDVPGSPITPSYSIDSLKEDNRAERQRVFNDPNDLYKVCIPDAANQDFTINASISTSCLDFENDQKQVLVEFRKQNTNITDETAATKFGNGKALVNTDEGQDDYEVDKACVDVQCAAVLATAVAAVALSIVPFAGPAAFAMQMAGRAAYKVFQVGRYMIKFVKPMKRKRKLIVDLAEIINSLNKITNKVVKMGNKQTLVLLFPLTAGAVSISLIAYKRNPKTIRGENMVIGLIAPLLGGLFIVGLGLFLAPSGFNEIFDQPDIKRLVSIQIFEEAGYFALKYSYIFGGVGQGCLLISCFCNYLERRREKKSNEFNTQSKAQKLLLSEKIAHEAEKIIEPAIFSIPGFYYCFVAMFDAFQYPYFLVGTRATALTLSVKTDLAEMSADFERTEGMDMETENSFCGLIGRIVQGIVGGIMDNVAKALSDFKALLKTGLDGLSDLISVLDGVDSVFQNLKIPKGFILPNFLVYIIPFGCSLAIIGFGIASYYSKNISKQSSKFAYTIAYLSFANILLHLTIDAVMQFMEDIDPGLIELLIEPGSGWFITIGASLGNIISAVVIYTNNVVPIN